MVGYLGTHGMAHKLDFILECLNEVNGNAHFLFIGDGAEKEKLLKMKSDLQLDNVTMLSSVPKNEIAKYISIIDIALVPLKRSDTFKTVIPSKIFENSAMLKPILLGVEGESKSIIENYRAGICFIPEDKADFLKQLNKIQTDKEFYNECKIGCQKLAADFDRKKMAQDMFAIVEKSIA